MIELKKSRREMGDQLNQHSLNQIKDHSLKNAEKRLEKNKTKNKSEGPSKI